MHILYIYILRCIDDHDHEGHHKRAASLLAVEGGVLLGPQEYTVQLLLGITTDLDSINASLYTS